MSETEDALDPSTDRRLERLRTALDSGRLQRVQRLLHSLPTAEIALLLESMPIGERQVVWGLVDPEDRGEVLVHVAEEVRDGLIREMPIEELVAATEGLEVDDLADLIENLPETVTQQLLRSMDLENRQRLEAVLSYPPDSAGGLMNTDTVTVRPDVSIDVVLRYLRLRGSLPEHTDALFVVDRTGRYLGVVSVNRLLTLDPELVIASVMDTEIRPIEVTASATEVAKQFENLDLVSAPVVNEQGILVGRITVDDVMDVVREEADHSLMSMAGLDEEEDLFAPILRRTRRRAIWLGVNLITAFIAARVVGLFEASIEQMVALAVLMPVVASMGGIAGSQTLVLTIRGLALGSIGTSNARSLLYKELAVAFANGVFFGVIVAVVTALWFGNLMLGLVIALALALNQINGVLTGVWLPLLLRKLGIDPALAGSVVLTTFTDTGGFFMLLGLGTLILL
ncbi:MAG TPA: magnesium transporter [Nevskiales bacterium]|nr:magnesium transporter [Nevskiales bacterium]